MMDAVFERISNPAVAIPIAVLVLYSTYLRSKAVSTVPGGIPWVGKDSTKLFADTRATFASLNHAAVWLREGYHKYSKHGRSYIFPDISGRVEILIPRSQLSWLLDQPDHVLSTSEYHYEVLEGDYAFTDARLLADPYHEHVIHKYLPRRVGQMIPGMSEEIAFSFDETWGVDTEKWREIVVFDNLMGMIPRAVNRMLVGLPLCRNQDYLTNMAKFAIDVVTTASLFLRFTPGFLKPIIGRIVTIPNRYHYDRTARHTLPIIKERLANFKRKEEDFEYDWEAPNDYISWQIALAHSENREDELTPDIISRRLMPLNFAAIHTTTLTITNCLFDIISSDPSRGYLEGIREQATRILAEDGGQWTKTGLARFYRADSAIRESMRVRNFMTMGVMRKVMPDEGVVNHLEGWTAPKGAAIGLDMHNIQHDPDIYPDPETYDAFRFSRLEEEGSHTAANEDSEDGAGRLKLKNTGLITTSDSFFPFGHGRHACPGRFFVALELKMLLAYMVMNYEVKPLATRPPNKWFGQTYLPPMKAKISVRRRECATEP